MRLSGICCSFVRWLISGEGIGRLSRQQGRRRRKRLSKRMECEIILLNRENSVFQVHVLGRVHPCQAVNNALSLLPSARVTGTALT